MSSTGGSSLKDVPRQQHSNFQSRTARDDAGELSRRWSTAAEEQANPSAGEDSGPADSNELPNPYEPATNDSTPPPREHSFTKRLFHIRSHDEGSETSKLRRRSVSGRRKTHTGDIAQDSLTVQMHNEAESKRANGDSSVPKAGLGPRPVGGNEKLGLFSGVYVPTCLNVLSILMFLRFGFILGLSLSGCFSNRLLTVS
jgi:hypothetical protein